MSAFDTWLDVAYAQTGGYEWSDFRVKWTGTQWAWSQQSGCSCYSFEDIESEYTVGDKATLIRAVHDFEGVDGEVPVERQRLMEDINGFRPPAGDA